MFGKIKALKEAVINLLNIKKIIDEEVRREIRIQETIRNAKSLTESGVSDLKIDEREVIVSLTSYGRRIYQVYLVIESLLEQTLKPNRIILWLDTEEFKTMEDLPLNLLHLCKRGLQIEFCENLRSYKKLIPTLRKYEQAIIITTDDDILYPEDFVERLIKAYKKDPNTIYFYRGHKMIIRNGILQPYKLWDFEVNLDKSSFLNFPTGCGGILYSMELLDKEIMNIEAFTRLAPTADDVWFKAMSLKKGVKCEQIKLEVPFREKFIFLDSTDNFGLAKLNLLQNKNDEQINGVFQEYNLYEKLYNRD